MKKFGKVSIILLLLLFLLCGCGDNAATNNPPAEPPAAETPQASEQPTDEPVDSPSYVPDSGAKPDMGILSGARQLGGNLYLIPNELTESAVQQNIARLGNDILAWSYHWNGEGSELLLSVIDTFDGSTVYRRSFTGLEQANVQVFSNGVAVSDWADGRIFVLNERLEDKKQYDLGTVGAIYLNTYANCVYIFESGRGIKAIDFDNTREDHYILDNVTGLYPSACDGRTVTFNCTDGETDRSVSGVLQMDTGEVFMCPFEGAVSAVEKSSGTWFGVPFGETNTYYIGNDKYPSAFSLPGMSFAELLYDDARVFVRSFGEAGGIDMALYSNDGIFISSCFADMAVAGPNGDPVWFEELGGYFLDITTAGGSDRLLFWDVSAPMTGQDLVLESVVKAPEPGSSVSKEVYELANTVGDLYGVEVIVAEFCNTTFGEFSAGAVYDEDLLNDAFNALTNALQRFPDGFFDKLSYSVYDRVEIHLVGPLSTSEQSSDGINFTGFVGAAVQEGTANIIALDITRPVESIEQTLYHEISHIIEMRLEFDANNKGGSFSEEKWDELNPEGFEYYDSRVGIPESVLYDGYDAWFIDVYSRINASEDRARLFEYYMMDYNWAFASSPGRLEKINYYLKCIYESFGNEGWEDKRP